MAVTAIVDAQPSDYRESRLCAAYVVPELAETLGASEGDILRVSTQRGRAALVRLVGPLPAGSQHILRFDRLTRQALKAYPHEEVTVEKVDLQTAQQVVLVPSVDLSGRSTPGSCRSSANSWATRARRSGRACCCTSSSPTAWLG